MEWTDSGLVSINLISFGICNNDVFKYLPQQTFVHHSQIEGYLFGDECITTLYTGHVQSSLVYDFSPFIETETHRRFLDISGNISYCVLSPAVEQTQGKILIAFRAFRCSSREKPVPHPIQQDLIYLQGYTRDLRPSGPGYFIAYGYPKLRIAEHLPVDGPQDPRAFKFKGRLYLMFHDGIPKKNPQSHHMIRTILWDIETNRPTVLAIKNNVFDTEVEALADKNWMSLVIQDALYFIQYLDPLLVIKCNLNGSCEYVPNLRFYPLKIDPLYDVLRGGTPFKHYNGKYHIALVHCKFFKSVKPYQVSAYTSHIILFDINTFRIVFISGHIPLNPELYDGRRRQNFTLHSFYFPTSMIVESLDSLLVFAHINDDSSCLLRISGIEKLLNDVIKSDRINSPKHGPPLGCIQNFLKSKHETYIKLQTTIN